MTFIGRTRELEFLESCYADKKAQLVFLYGRRRVGKTETLSKFAAGKQCVFFAAQASTKEEQLASFSRQMFEAGAPAGRYISQYADWQSALQDIDSLPFGDARKLVVFDEFPYLVKSDPSLPSVLQNLWDHTLRHGNVMIVICGSAMSFIEKELLSQKAPLYGRATGILKLEPMTYREAAEFLPRYSAEDRILAYSVLGGIPHYLAQFDPDENLETNIRQRILTKGAALYSETEFLMRQEFREIAVYNAIIQAVAMGATQLSDIANRVMLSAQKTSVYIGNLVEVGILEREFPVGSKMVERSKGMRGLYRVIDGFFRFWYAFVFPNRSDLDMGDVSGVWTHDIQPMLHDFAATPYERICAQWLHAESIAGRLPFRAADIGRWWNGRDEIDVVATSRNSDQLILGECKFRNKQVDTAILRTLQGKAGPFAAHDIYYYLFALNGFEPALRQLAGIDAHVVLVSGENLYDD
ncbi:ATP-binding protein [Bifidobacterium jacchi]|uniref:ATP-binding protein n=1 Tax=Bifidobacterium jacchi TaxID=2490545 RepID=A0A5N5RJE1_9BIFI|nr:ATP-binding protein [Bifidobacterium jacchi]KAB5607414.1 ATP-binding protein [Bifidobacterium jacchi]